MLIKWLIRKAKLRKRRREERKALNDNKAYWYFPFGDSFPPFEFPPPEFKERCANCGYLKWCETQYNALREKEKQCEQQGWSMRYKRFCYQEGAWLS